MNHDFQRLMNEATRLTRAGDLQAATAAIQAALCAGRRYPSGSDPTVIDVDALEISVASPVTIPPEAPAIPTRSRTNRPSGRADCFIGGTHAQGTIARDYKLYIPPDPALQPRPLVVMLHGCTQGPDDFAAGTAMNDLARQQGCFVLYPAQSARANPNRCWNWFKHNHQRRGRGEPSLLAGMTGEIMRRHEIDSDRVYVAGLSAGGAMAAILGAAYPDVYAAVGVHSGLAAGAASDLQTALAAMKRGSRVPLTGPAVSVPTIVFHGDRDATVHPSNAEQVIAACVDGSLKAEVVTSSGDGRRASTRHVYRADDGRVVAEHWVVHGSPHAWSGGRPSGSYTDADGPDASAQMLRFFMEHPRGTGR